MTITRGDEINAFVTGMLGGMNQDPDDPELRLAALTGLQEAWREDDELSLEKTLYMLALTGLISVERLKTMRPMFMV